MRYHTHSAFERQVKKIQKPLRARLWERLALLESDPVPELLHDHKLNPPFDGYRSINITGDLRLIYKRIDADTLYLRTLGTHHQLYRS